MKINERQVYNLPGFGLMQIKLFPHAFHVYKFLEGYNHISRLQQIDQLGPIREVFPGAHHTRYEYLMAQLALITELCHLKDALPGGVSLSSDRRQFGKLSLCNKRPSNGEILMVLALLCNIGHLQTTFSGERALLKFLRDNQRIRKSFRSGLPKEDVWYFDHVISNFDTHRVNYIIAIFLLNRYRRRKNGNEIVDFCLSIIRSYIQSDFSGQNENIFNLWRLYKNIRRLTYLALDTHYTPVPFSLDLSSIFLNLEYYLTEIFIEDSQFQNTLSRLESVMRDSVYLSPESLLNHSYVSGKIFEEINNNQDIVTNVASMWNVLSSNNAKDLFNTTSNSFVDDYIGKNYGLIFINYNVYGVSKNILPDPQFWVDRSQSKVGARYCKFGAELDPKKENLNIAAGIKPNLLPRTSWEKTLHVCKQLIDLDISVYKQTNISEVLKKSNGKSILRVLLPNAFGYDKYIRIHEPLGLYYSPVLCGYGSTKMSNIVDEHIKTYEINENIDTYTLNEISVLKDTLQSYTYRGCLILFYGSTIISNDSQELAEFDGIVFLISRNISQPTLLVIEAKNQSSGNTVSERELNKKINNLNLTNNMVRMNYIGNKGAFAEITLP